MRQRFEHSAMIEIMVVGSIVILVAAFIAIDRNNATSTPTAAENEVLAGSAGMASLQRVGMASSESIAPEAARTGVGAGVEIVDDKLQRAIPGATATAAPDVDELIPLPLPADIDLYVRPTDVAPALTQEEVMTWLADGGIAFAAASEWNGAPVTVTAVYGSTTYGHPAPDGMWLGPRNLLLSTGETLDHIENRLTWVLIYEHAPLSVPVGDQTVTPAHTLYVIDVETRSLLVAMMYAIAE